MLTRLGLPSLLSQDLMSTLERDYLDVVREMAKIQREFAEERDWYLTRVGEEVQQYIHDCFIDTRWPACPRHPNHPLWIREGSWWCERDGEAVAAVGSLRQKW